MPCASGMMTTLPSRPRGQINVSTPPQQVALPNHASALPTLNLVGCGAGREQLFQGRYVESFRIVIPTQGN